MCVANTNSAAVDELLGSCVARAVRAGQWALWSQWGGLMGWEEVGYTAKCGCGQQAHLILKNCAERRKRCSERAWRGCFSFL